MQERAYQPFLRPFLYIFLRETGIESICGIVFQFIFTHHGTVGLDVFYADELIHLPYFLLQGHSFQEVFHSVLHGGGRVFIYFRPVSAAGT